MNKKENKECFPNKSVFNITKNLYMDEETADVHFIFDVDGHKQRVPAHKNILVSGSSVFRSMFCGKLKEEHDINIVDVSPNRFMEFLTIFYLQKTIITSENVAEFTNLAKKYDTPEGLEVCEKFLLNNTDVSELCSRLEFAINFNLNKLKYYCMAEIRLNIVEVFKSDAFVNCTVEMLKFILLLDDLSCLEIDVFNACKGWAENACSRKGYDITDMQNLRRELAECFYLIPFTNMKMESFCNFISNGENRAFFTSYEIVDMMGLITSGKSTELTNKFISSCNITKPFDWVKERLLVCARHKKNDGRGIYSFEYTTFSSRRKLLFGGFGFVDMKYKDNSVKTLSATIIITKQSGSIQELQDQIQIVIHVLQSNDPLYVKLNKPLLIIPQIKYNICVDFTANDLDVDGFVEGWQCFGSQFTSSFAFVHKNIWIEFHKHSESKYSKSCSIISKIYFNRLQNSDN